MAWIRIKPKYIRKYDYKRSYTRPKDQWFWPIDEIEKVINNQILSEYKKQHKNLVVDVDNDDDTDIFSNEKDLDLEQFGDGPKDEAIVKEGQIIDKLAKQHITNVYPNNLVIDFDDKKYQSWTNEQIANETLKLLTSKDDVLIFQACFIALKKAIARPDAIVKKGENLILIEVKSTNKFEKGQKEKKFTDKKTKKHIFDLVYQKKVIEKVLEEFKLNFLISCQLCAIDNRKSAKKYTTNFDIVFCDDKVEKFYSAHKDIVDDFWNRINELINTKISPTFSLDPNDENHTIYGDNECWPLFKEYYYVSSKYPFFGLSAQTILNPRKNAASYLYNKYPNIDPTNLKKMVNVANDEKCLMKKAGSHYHSVINSVSNKQKYFIPQNVLLTLSRKLKNKKVYFDFETLNSALAAFDGCYPYRQVVVQASIIKDHGDGKFIVNNLICDPKNITTKWFKKVVDTILDGVDNVNEYSFVVYNKAFEHRCLNDMIHFINEKEYTNKIVSFNGPLDEKGAKNNYLFDLADFFDNRRIESCCYIWPAKGFYTIKKILDFVMNDKNSKAFKQVGCKNYKSLNVQNGSQAQDKINNRFFGVIDDKKWKAIEKNLKQYCENDVRAMIALEYWLKEHQFKS